MDNQKLPIIASVGLSFPICNEGIGLDRLLKVLCCAAIFMILCLIAFIKHLFLEHLYVPGVEFKTLSKCLNSRKCNNFIFICPNATRRCPCFTDENFEAERG